MVPTRRVTDYLAIGLGIVSGTVVMIRPSSGKEVSYIRYELLVTVETVWQTSRHTLQSFQRPP
jgi:hypothetical protein